MELYDIYGDETIACLESLRNHSFPFYLVFACGDCAYENKVYQRLNIRNVVGIAVAVGAAAVVAIVVAVVVAFVLTSVDKNVEIPGVVSKTEVLNAIEFENVLINAG